MPRGSTAWQLVPGLVPAPGEPGVCKSFCDAFAETPLRSLLEREGVRRLVIAGAQSDHCIRTTVQRAAVEGYSVTLVSDAHTTASSSFGGVASSGQQIVAHTNRCFAALCDPGVETGLARHDAVTF